ncbi:hypothetical protein QN277_009532 [Acacia crassicarpa]|uniref:Uncharacterized protein n=1 Tax=Acacia crassicarpa TaxID=499986 RepID=A0AAE1JMB8_9FABA|nr:hypothetical protein QN277_009532 [Acacia crassicarpa]
MLRERERVREQEGAIITTTSRARCWTLSTASTLRGCSPGQGMISFTHLAKNVDTAELGGYADVILDACCQNIAPSDEIWCQVAESSVVLVIFVQRNNPRNPCVLVLLVNTIFAWES